MCTYNYGIGEAVKQTQAAIKDSMAARETKDSESFHDLDTEQVAESLVTVLKDVPLFRCTLPSCYKLHPTKSLRLCPKF